MNDSNVLHTVLVLSEVVWVGGGVGARSSVVLVNEVLQGDSVT